jgi:hypothetical protein
VAALTIRRKAIFNDGLVELALTLQKSSSKDETDYLAQFFARYLAYSLSLAGLTDEAR